MAITVDARPYSSNNGGNFRARAAPAAPSYSDDSSYSASAGNRRARQAAEPEPKPEPYSFTYETTDEYGTTLTRTEAGDEQGNVKGSYMYRDPEGIYRTVEYADNGDGFSANVQVSLRVVGVCSFFVINFALLLPPTSPTSLASSATSPPMLST